MQETVTRKDLESTLKRLAEAMGVPDGQLYLDSMNPGDGRTYVIEMGDTDLNVSTRPFGSRRYKARALYEMMLFALDALKIA